MPHPVLRSILPLGAVPLRLRLAAGRILAGWGYGWDDITFAGTAALTRGGEVWILAIKSDELDIGDEVRSAGGRGAGLSMSAYSGGVIPATPYQAQVFEHLGRGGGWGLEPPREPPPGTSECFDTEPEPWASSPLR